MYDIKEIPRNFILVYFDDIIIYSKTWKGYFNYLRIVFKILKKVGLIVKIKKCNFVKKKLKFLRYIISRKGIRTDSKKIKKIVNMELSKNLKELKSKLDLFFFYWQYIIAVFKIYGTLGKFWCRVFWMLRCLSVWKIEK